MECIVEYDYVAAQDDELTIHRGDIIKNVCTFEDGWKRGYLNGKEGVFPDNFVRMIKSNSKPENTESDVFTKFKEQLISNGEKEESLYKIFQLNQENDAGKYDNLSAVNKNNCVPKSTFEFVHENTNVTKNSMENEIEPLNYSNESNKTHSMSKKEYLTQKQPPPQPQQKQQSQKQIKKLLLPSDKFAQTVVVMFDYKAENVDELSLEVGELINVLDKNLVDDGWWKGAKKNGEIGIFPSNFVEPVIDNFACSSIMKQPVKDDLNLFNSHSNQIREQSNVMNSVSTNDLTLDKRIQQMNLSFSSGSLFKTPTPCIKTKSVNVTSEGKYDIQKKFKQLNDLSKHMVSYNESSKGDDLSNSYEKSRMKGSRNVSPAFQDYHALKSEFDKFRSDVEYKFSRLNIRIQTLIEEIDEEKKQRAASEIELIRLRRVVHMLDIQNINSPAL